MSTAEKLLHLEPARREAIADLLAEQINDSNMTSIIELPDIYGHSPAQQISSQHPPEADPNGWRINMTLLLGIAAHKSNTAASAHLDHNKTPLILGAHPSDILKEFFVPDSMGRSMVDDLKLPLSSEYKNLLRISWISPDSCPRLLSKIKSIAEAKIMHELYRGPADTNILNPKVAFLWGGITSWRVYQLSPEFRDWLAGFRARAKNQIFLSLIDEIEAGNQLAYSALHMARNVRSETPEVNADDTKTSP